MHSLLVTLAPYSLIAAAVFALLFVVDLVAMMIHVARGGKIDPEEGRVVTENRPLTTSDMITMGDTGAPGGRYWGKHKVFLSRSTHITDMSLVDGSATKAQRRLAHGIQLGLVLFGLAFMCLAISLLPSQPVFGFALAAFAICWLFTVIRSPMKGRAEALRKLKDRRASREAHRHKPRDSN
jgi:hypothetical protein